MLVMCMGEVVKKAELRIGTHGIRVGAVRPGLGRTGGPLGRKILTLSSGVFLSAFLSPSGFPRMGNTSKLSLAFLDGWPSVPYLSVPGPLISLSPFGSPSWGHD